MPLTNLLLELIYASNTILSLFFLVIVIVYLIDSKDLRTQKNLALLGMYAGITCYYFSYFLFISFYNLESIELYNTLVSILAIASITVLLIFMYLFVVLEADYPYGNLITKGVVTICLFFSLFTLLRYLTYSRGMLIFDSIYRLFVTNIWFFLFFLYAELLILFTVSVCSLKRLCEIFFPKNRLNLIHHQYLKLFTVGLLLGGVSELIKVIRFDPFFLFLGGLISMIGLSITTFIIVRTRKHIRDIAWTIIEFQLEELKELDVLKDQYVDFTSHEIRTPLSIIWGNIQLLQRAEKNKNLIKQQREKIFDTITRNYHRIEKLLNTSYDLSRIRRNLFELNKEQADLKEVIENTVKDMQKYAEKKGISITFGSEGSNIRDIAIIDTDRIDQVLRNLIENSVKFSDKGKIQVTLRDTPSEYIVSIEDEGIGIDSDNFDHLFDLLRYRNNTKTPDQELGLGLYISRSIVELHHGRIWVKSEGRGMGSKFYFSIPKGNVS